MTPRPARLGLLATLASCGLLGGIAAATIGDESSPLKWRQHQVSRPLPPVVEPAAGSPASAPPKDAVILFDGSGLDAWRTGDGKPAGWKVRDGVMEIVPGAGSIFTKAEFGDMQIHAEWEAPAPAKGSGQDRGNSGILIWGQFEIQVLDSYNAVTYADGQAGAIYGQYPPLFNATRPPGEWQTYDIVFRRPRFDAAGKLAERARITVVLNGIVVQNNEEPWGQTSWIEPHPYDPSTHRGPIELQDHSHPVRFRNLWVRELPDRPAPTAEDVKRPPFVRLSQEELDKCVGEYAGGNKPGDLRVRITSEEGHLLLKLPFRPTPIRFDPVSSSHFYAPNSEASLVFKDGAVTFRVGDGSHRLMGRAFLSRGRK